MKQLLFLVFVLGVLWSTPAMAVTLGFTQPMVDNGFVDTNGNGAPNPGDFRLTVPGSWNLEGDTLFSSLPGSSIVLYGIPDVINARFTYPEFTFQGVDLYTNTQSDMQFLINGYALSHDLSTVPLFTYRTMVTTFLRLTTDGLRDPQGNLLNQRIGQLVITPQFITVSNLENLNGGVGCLGVTFSGPSQPCDPLTLQAPLTTTAVPEPLSLWLLALGFVSLGLRRLLN